jgi:hypothetical protein
MVMHATRQPSSIFGNLPAAPPDNVAHANEVSGRVRRTRQIIMRSDDGPYFSCVPYRG